MTGITPDTRPTEGRRRIGRIFARPLQAWVYEEVVRRSMQVGAMPVMIYMETVTEPTEPWRSVRSGRRAGISVRERDFRCWT